MTADRLTILDEIELMPGQLDAFLDALETEYRPGAEARGMSLEHTWMTPPFESPESSTTVFLVWRIDGAAGFWEMRSQSGGEEVARWWKRCDAFAVERTRRVVAEVSDREELARAGKLAS